MPAMYLVFAQAIRWTSVEAELRGVRDAVSVDDRVVGVERRELLPEAEVRGELFFAGLLCFEICHAAFVPLPRRPARKK